MTPQEVASLVDREISEYVYRPPDFQPIGTPWSMERVQEEIAKLRESLVEPRLIRVINRDVYDNQYELLDAPAAGGRCSGLRPARVYS